MVLITSSILSKAIIKPSKIWALLSAASNSNCVLLTITSFRCFKNSSIISFNVRTFGRPFTKANILIPKVVCNCVCLYKLFKTTIGVASRFNSITIRIPSRSDSSLISEISSSTLALTKSAIFSINEALPT